MKAAPENYLIQAVSHAMNLLGQFHEDDAELGIADLSKRLNLQRANVLRLVETLETRDYIEMNKVTGKYRLGIKSMELGLVATQQFDYAIHARPFLDELKQHCHETCYFSVLKDGQTFCLDSVESDLPIRVFSRLGYRQPLHCTAAGKVLLSFMDPKKQIDLLSGSKMRRVTASTIIDPELLQNELDLVAQNGYAIDYQENEAGIIEIAAPVFDSHGAMVGALSIVVPHMRLAGARLKSELIPLICHSASRFSRKLGQYRPKEVLTKPSQPASKTKTISRKVIEKKPVAECLAGFFC